MTMRRWSQPRWAGQHRGGNKVPTVLVLADRMEGALAELICAALERLHARGHLNFSIYIQSGTDAGGGACWTKWIRERKPGCVLVARPAQLGDDQIVDYCHNRGVAVVWHEGGTVLDPQHDSRMAEAREDVLTGCDLVYAMTPEAAEKLRVRFPGQRVLAQASLTDADALASQLMDIVLRQARRSPGQKLVGTFRRAWVLAGNMVQKVLRRAWAEVQREGDPARAPLRVLFVANSFLPTLQLCFTRPLQPLASANALAWELLADIQLRPAGLALSGGRARWARRRIARFQPHLIVFCRYSGAHARLVTDWARTQGVPTIFHLDDDLLNVPPELGQEKYAFHNEPTRLAAVRHLLSSVDLVYCSTKPLLNRMRQHGFRGVGTAAQVHCPGEVLRDPPDTGPLIIGYMGIDHAHDFQVALPALVRVLERNPEVRFEIFGPIAKPAELDRFGDRISRVGFVRSYDEFLSTFANLGWSIGICPLADTPFNRFKANNKWVEYTSVGVATVATAGMLYDDCCAEGCGLLANDDVQWEEALQALIDSPHQRSAMVGAAQERLRRDYSPAALRQQLQDTFLSVLAGSVSSVAEAAGGRRLMTMEAIRGD